MARREWIGGQGKKVATPRTVVPVEVEGDAKPKRTRKPKPADG